MNLPKGTRSPVGGQVGAGGRGGHHNAPANFTVGAVGFGPMWSDEEDLRDPYNAACASIVRAEREADELRAEVAMLKQGMVIIAEERDKARDTVVKLRRERAAQDAVIATYRDEACRESCRDKAQADGGWANI